MANNNPNQNKDQGKQGGMQSQQQSQQQGQQKGHQSGGREVNPSRPSGEPGKIPQNAGSALDFGKGGTSTQQQQQSKSQSAQSGQSKSMKNDIGQKHGTPTKGNDSRSGRDESEQDEDAPTGIGQAVRKGDAESIKHGEDDLGHRSDKNKGDNKPM